jgi:alkylation response protein AidB-like acyl-CoA dehydrogenase
MAPLKASSATDGFFQVLPSLPPLYTSAEHPSPASGSKGTNPVQTSDDTAFARVIELYIPSQEYEPRREIQNAALRALDRDALAHSVDAEVNLPVVKGFTTFGDENKFDSLWTTAGWRELKAIGQENGTIASAYESQEKNWNRRVHQFGINHVWDCTGTLTGCPFSMTDGAAKLLKSHLDDPDGDQPGFSSTIRYAYSKLISRNPEEAWTSGQWMTERTGGSDVSGTETVARRLTAEELEREAAEGRDCDAHENPLGPWRIDGFKWFSSATDSEMTVMLAQTSKGLGVFLAPMRRMAPKASQSTEHRPLTELNGIRIQRLKNKMGTKSLPTAELELKGVRAWQVGQEGKGIKEISTILNLTRLHTSAASLAYWARGLQVCRAYSKVRKVRGGLLQDNKQHLRWMANETVKYWAAAHFSFFGIAIFGTLEQGWIAVTKGTRAAAVLPKDQADLSALLRLLTPVMKAQVSVAAVLGLRENMECLGGVGYCENNEDGGILNLARIFRDSVVQPIWEGTVSVMAEDVVRVLTDQRIGNGNVIGNVFAPWVHKLLTPSEGQFPEECGIVQHRLEALSALVTQCNKEELLFRGRDLLGHLEAIVCSCLLLFDASTNEDGVAAEVARRWVGSIALSGSRRQSTKTNWEDEAAMDKKIFLGPEQVLLQTLGGRL